MNALQILNLKFIMPKRSCPFEINHAPQLKRYISEKEQSSTKEKVLENMWNRTRELLIKGAKKHFDEEAIRDSYKEELKCDFCLNVNLLDIHDCVVCNGVFCSNCSLNLYKDDVTERVCLSCVD
ncbi:hypothetical protein Trydic_g13368 [Trypoxylus dichotomus]